MRGVCIHLLNPLLKQLFQYNETETLVIILADIATYSLTHDYEALPTCI